jgi:hypothetical protein
MKNDTLRLLFALDCPSAPWQVSLTPQDDAAF